MEGAAAGGHQGTMVEQMLGRDASRDTKTRDSITIDSHFAINDVVENYFLKLGH